MVGLISNLMSLESSLLPLLLCSCLVIAAAVTLATLWLCLCYYYNFSRIPGPLDWFSSRLYKVEKNGQTHGTHGTHWYKTCPEKQGLMELKFKDKCH